MRCRKTWERRPLNGDKSHGEAHCLEKWRFLGTLNRVKARGQSRRYHVGEARSSWGGAMAEGGGGNLQSRAGCATPGLRAVARGRAIRVIRSENIQRCGFTPLRPKATRGRGIRGAWRMLPGVLRLVRSQRCRRASFFEWARQGWFEPEHGLQTNRVHRLHCTLRILRLLPARRRAERDEWLATTSKCGRHPLGQRAGRTASPPTQRAWLHLGADFAAASALLEIRRPHPPPLALPANLSKH